MNGRGRAIPRHYYRDMLPACASQEWQVVDEFGDIVAAPNHDSRIEGSWHMLRRNSAGVEHTRAMCWVNNGWYTALVSRLGDSGQAYFEPESSAYCQRSDPRDLWIEGFRVVGPLATYAAPPPKYPVDFWTNFMFVMALLIIGVVAGFAAAQVYQCGRGVIGALEAVERLS